MKRLVVIAALLTWPMLAWAAAAFVNSTGSYSGTAATTISSSSINITGSNTIVVVTSALGSTNSVSSIADSAGNTFITAGASCRNTNASVGFIEIWYANNVTGNASDIVTVTFSASVSGRRIHVLQYSGIATSTPIEACTGGSQIDAISVTSPSFSPAASGNVNVMGVFNDDGGYTYSAGTNYTLRTSDGHGAAEDRVGAPSGSQTASMSGNASTNDWVYSVVSIKPQTGGGGGTPASISYVSTGAFDKAKNGNCLPGNPSGIQNNDILILQVVSDDQISHTVNNSYTQVVQGNGAGSFQRHSVWWKRTNGTESSTTVTHSSGREIICVITAWRGVEETGTPYNANSSSVNDDASCTATSASSITTTADKSVILFSASNQGGSASNYSNWASIATNEIFDTYSNISGDPVHLALAYGTQTSLGATGAQTATIGPTVACDSTALVALTPETTVSSQAPATPLFGIDWTEISTVLDFINAVGSSTIGATSDCALLSTDHGTSYKRLGNVRALTLHPYGYVRLSAREANSATQTGTYTCRLMNLTDSIDLTGDVTINNTTSCVTGSVVKTLPASTAGVKRIACECKDSVSTDDPNIAWCTAEFF